MIVFTSEDGKYLLSTVEKNLNTTALYGIKSAADHSSTLYRQNRLSFTMNALLLQFRFGRNTCFLVLLCRLATGKMMRRSS